MTWSVVFLDEKVREAFEEFPLDIRASFQRIVELIQSHGLERVREPYVKHLEGSLVIVHVFVKKTQRTPRREIMIALKRAKEI